MPGQRAVTVTEPDGSFEANDAEASVLELTSRALSHVLGLFHWQLRGDTPLADLGADSVAIIVFGDVAEAFAAKAQLPDFAVDDELLRVATTVGDLAQALSWSGQ